MKKETLNKLIAAIKANYKSKVTVWGNPGETFIECKGFTGPSNKVERIIDSLGLTIVKEKWSDGSDYTGYYYWVAELAENPEDILDRIDEMMDILRESCADMSIDELYEQARMEHIWALGSRNDDEATEHEITSDAYRLLAQDKEREQLRAKMKAKEKEDN